MDNDRMEFFGGCVSRSFQSRVWPPNILRGCLSHLGSVFQNNNETLQDGTGPVLHRDDIFVFCHVIPTSGVVGYHVSSNDSN
jgi:hypothetical protein